MLVMSDNFLEKEGYKRIEADWRLHRGGYYREEFKITDVQISEDGKYIWFKTNIPEEEKND